MTTTASKRTTLAVFSPLIGDNVHAYLREEISSLSAVCDIVLVSIARVTGPGSWSFDFPHLSLTTLDLREFPSIGDSTASGTFTNYSLIPGDEKAIFWSHEHQQRVREFLKQHGVQAIFAQWLNENRPLLDVAASLRIPYVVRTHGSDICAGLVSADTRRAYQEYRHANAILAGSEYARRHLASMGLPQDRIVVAPFPFPQIEPAHRVDALEEVRVQTVSRLDPVKGLTFAVEGFCKARQQCSELRLEIIGDGPLRSTLEDQVRTAGLQSDIRFLGHLSGDELLEVRRGAQVFLQASVVPEGTLGETFGFSVLEAIALGLPSIVTNSSGLCELVSHGESGFVVPEADSIAIAEALVRLSTDAALRMRMGEHALAHARKVYSVENHQRLLLSLLTGEL